MADKLQAVDATRKAIKQERQIEVLDGNCGVAQPKVDWPALT